MPMPTDCGEETHLPLLVQNECSSVHSTGTLSIKEIKSPPLLAYHSHSGFLKAHVRVHTLLRNALQ